MKSNQESNHLLYVLLVLFALVLLVNPSEWGAQDEFERAPALVKNPGSEFTQELVILQKLSVAVEEFGDSTGAVAI